MAEYKILLDLISYDQVYTGNIERELTDFIFGSKFDVPDWIIPEKWYGKLLPCFDDEEHGESLCGIEGKVYNEEEVKKYHLKGKTEKGAPKNHHCSRIYWLFSLPSNKEARKLATYLLWKTHEFFLTKPPNEFSGRKQFKDRREIPVEIYLRKEIRIKWR